MNAESYHNLGNAQRAQGNLADAAASYERALSLCPDLAETHANLSFVLLRQGHLERAETHCRQAVQIKSQCVEAWDGLGNAQWAQGKFDEAALSYQEALRLRPAFAQAHSNLGATRQMQGNLVAAVASYRQALRHRPDFVQALINLAAALRALGELDEAEVHLNKALSLQPDCADAYYKLGAIYSEQGKTAESSVCWQRALTLEASNRLRIALATQLPVIYQSVEHLSASRDRLIQGIGSLNEQGIDLDIDNEPAMPLFYLAYQGGNDREITRDIARLCRVSDEAVAAPARRAPAKHDKIRVGLLSAHFRSHTIGHLTRGLVATLSRDDFELTVLSVSSSDDDIAGAFKRHADRFVEVPRHLPSARRVVAKQDLDVLVYADIGMEELSSTLAFSRLAPVQCAFWGHPVTTGIDTIDYFLSAEALEIDEADQHYTESLVRLKCLPVFYYRPELTVPPKRKADFSFAAEDHLYGCPQTLFKFHPEFDGVLAAILRGDPRGKLVLIEGKHPHWAELLRQRFALTMPDVVDQIRFLPVQSRPDFLGLLAMCDVLLDPLHFGGGNSSYEALAFGTPIVTLPSKFLRGRITLALYKQMGVMDCVAQSTQEYINIALQLGTDRAYRETIQRIILGASAVLYENSAGIRDLEEFLRRAVQP
ncbi:MAG TPA: tetratricopeptide repeat protein [Gemmataceae bacterium]|nr:tetratricopeptide repeat protein [Gemmataceae bacterium]